jgi:hypothetical protein
MKNEPEDAEYRYKVGIEECDVEDREALKLYRDKRYEWLSWYGLRKGDPNTIQGQIFSMIFLDLAYRTLAIPRQKTDDGPNVAAQAGLLAHLLDQGYVANQILAIRRMLDHRKDVVSVRRLLDDITENRILLTREIYVCHDGLPYDSEAWQAFPPTIPSQMWGIEAPGFGNYLGSRIRHEIFDRLSGVSSTARKRGDLIRESVFEELRKWLVNDCAQRLVLLSHKFFAHAATVDSRDSLDYSGVAIADVDTVQRAIIRVERAITDLLLFIGIARSVVPMPPLGLLKGLEHPYALNEAISKMENHWEKLTTERNKWANGIADDLWTNLCPALGQVGS